MKTRKVWADFGPDSRSDGDCTPHAQPPQACKGDDVLYIGALHKITSIEGMVNNWIVETKGILGARTSRENQADSMDPAAKAAKAAAGGQANRPQGDQEGHVQIAFGVFLFRNRGRR